MTFFSRGQTHSVERKTHSGAVRSSVSDTKEGWPELTYTVNRETAYFHPSIYLQDAVYARGIVAVIVRL